MNDLNQNICKYPIFRLNSNEIKTLSRDNFIKKYKKQIELFKNQLFNYFICRIDRKLTQNHVKKLRKAYEVAFKVHLGQFRKVSGEPYIVHPVEVALIVANEMGLDLIAIQAALLHDVVEDTFEPEMYNIDFIRREFGEAIAITVDGVTKMTKIGGKTSPYSNQKLETFRKMILSISKEYRVILIKIADRLHNMRTMEGMPPEKQKIKSAENLFVYARFAEAIGMFDIKIEMEDLSFMYLFPNEYKKILDEDNKIKPYRHKYLENLKLELSQLLKNLPYNLSFKIVRKSYYEVWQKLKSKPQLELKNIHNIESLRIILDVPDDQIDKAAFDVFRLIEQKYGFIQTSWHNWLKEPKPNGFKALVFDIIHRDDQVKDYIPQIAEIQILSKQGDIIAQKGANFERIKERISNQEQDESIYEFIDRIIKELDTQNIYVYTPKGDIIQLPKGSTVLDFAFKIHTELGLHCLGAKINNEFTRPLTYELNSGQMVEVITSSKHEPDYDWLRYVVTDKARREILSYLKNKNKNKDKTDQEKKQQPIFNFGDNLPLIINNNTNFILASCCNPLPGDDAVAVIDDRNKITIHRSDCPKYTATTTKNNIAPVKWLIQQAKYIVRVNAMDRMGLLLDITKIISQELHLNMREVHMKIDDADMVLGSFIIKVQHNSSDKECLKRDCSLDDVKNLANLLKQVDGVISVDIEYLQS